MKEYKIKDCSNRGVLINSDKIEIFAGDLWKCPACGTFNKKTKNPNIIKIEDKL